MHTPPTPEDMRVLREQITRLQAQVAELGAALDSSARTDALTGLANRPCFSEKLAGALARSRRQGHPVALMCLDVAGFKTINTTFGHGTGDEVLKCLGERLLASVRETDTVARLAGDEFGLILEGLHTAAEPQFIARKLMAAVSRPFELPRTRLIVHARIGIAYQADGRGDAAPLLAAADKALREAKAAGANTFRLAML